MGWKGTDWASLVQDRDRWWAVARVVKKLEVPKVWGTVSFQSRTRVEVVQ